MITEEVGEDTAAGEAAGRLSREGYAIGKLPGGVALPVVSRIGVRVPEHEQLRRLESMTSGTQVAVVLVAMAVVAR